jgi:hypothetical protein
MDDFTVGGLAAMAELNYLRLEAMDLFEYCLTEGQPDRLLVFIEEQISRDPPFIELLHEISEDLHQRLLGLREYHFDVLDRVGKILAGDFGIEVGPLDNYTGTFELYREADLDTLIVQIRERNPNLVDEDEVLLHKMLDTSLETASQLRGDIHMTENLYLYVSDWADGLGTAVMRRFWAEERSENYHEMRH